MSARALGTLGLCLEMVGATLLLFFNVSGGPNKGGGHTFVTMPDPIEARRYTRYLVLSRSGFLLIAGGCALQAWSLYR